MRASMLPLRWHRPAALRVAIVLGASLALVGLVVGTATGVGKPSQDVTVVNAADSPVPVTVTNQVATQAVTGSVSVTNLPATQSVSGSVGATQSGTWNVGITGSPEVTSGDTTELLGSFAGSVPGGGAFTDAVFADMTAYRSIRVLTNCFSGAACADIDVNVYTIVGGRSYLMDQFPMQNFVAATHVYEVAGQTLALQLQNNHASALTNIGAAVFGRTN